MISLYSSDKRYFKTEYLSTNRFGGYSQFACDFTFPRVYSSLLTASFHAPQDRRTVFDGFQESAVTSKKLIHDKDENLIALFCELSPEAFPKNNDIYTFSPYITFREPDQAINDKGLKFDTLVDGSSALLFPRALIGNSEKSAVSLEAFLLVPDSYDCPYVISDENIFLRKNERYVTGLSYPVDARFGFKGAGSSFIPIDICVNRNISHNITFSHCYLVIICGAYLKARESVFNKHKKSFLQTITTGNTLNSENIIPDAVAPVHHGFASDNELLREMKSVLTHSADSFIVDRESTQSKTILAGFPWFLDWGRDTMIALPGLTLSTGRFRDAKEILTSFTKYIRNGLLPNVFPSSALDDPVYNTIDASLWFVNAVYELYNTTPVKTDADEIRTFFIPYLEEIVHAYEHGTDYGIKMNSDSLISGGTDASHQLTWMDVRINNVAVTPRHGYPVEIQALWYNALCILYEFTDKTHYLELSEKVKKSFLALFVRPDGMGLYDCVIPKDIFDKENTDKTNTNRYIESCYNKNIYYCDTFIRPNQLYASSLRYTMLSHDITANVFNISKEHLLTPCGIRTLSPVCDGYIGTYDGELLERDKAYHMGTVWPFLFGTYADTCIRCYDGIRPKDQIISELCETLLSIYDHMMNDGCIGGIAEVFNGTGAYEGKGCYNQAWSVGEILRIVCRLLEL